MKKRYLVTYVATRAMEVPADNEEDAIKFVKIVTLGQDIKQSNFKVKEVIE